MDEDDAGIRKRSLDGYLISLLSSRANACDAMLSGSCRCLPADRPPFVILGRIMTLSAPRRRSPMSRINSLVALRGQ